MDSINAAPAPVEPSILKIDGPPGAGKTRLLAREACRLLQEEGVTPSRVLLLAMTRLNRKRIQNYLKQEASLKGVSVEGVQVETLDDWLLSILRAHHAPSEGTLNLLSEYEARLLLQALVRQTIPAGHALYHASASPSFARAVWELFRQWQVDGVDPSQLSLADGLPTEAFLNAGDACDATAASRLALFADLYQRFLTKTREASLLSVSDLGNRVRDCLHTQPEVAKALCESYQAILIDEAQELSEAHHAVLAQLATLSVRVVLAGTSGLSVRRFRGAEPQAFSDLAPYTSYAGTQETDRQTTVQNIVGDYRCNQDVLSLFSSAFPYFQMLSPANVVEPASLESPEQEPQAAEKLSFATCQDAESEAKTIAEQVTHFVKTAFVDGRAAQWQDCVVLLRSARFKPLLVSAFLEKGIPFRSECLPDGLIAVQHQLYDFFKILAALEALQIDPEALDSPALSANAFQESLDANALSLSGSLDTLHDLNQHLRRWLEADLAHEEALSALWHGGVSSAQGGTSEGCLWAALLKEATASALIEALQWLQGCYRDYRQSGLWLSLWDALQSRLCGAGLAVALDESQSFEANLLLSALKEQLTRLNAHHIKTFQKPLPLPEFLTHYAEAWEGLDTHSLLEQGGHRERGVRFLSLHQAQGEEFPWVAIPFLVSGEFPRTRHLPDLLAFDQDISGQASADGLGDIASLGGYRLEEAEELRLLALGLTRATHRLVLSCHQASGEEPIHPSSFYQRLLTVKQSQQKDDASRRGASLPSRATNSAAVSEDALRESSPEAHASENVDVDASEVMETMLSSRYASESRWSTLEKQSEEALFDASETITLSASSIKTYMTCPRQFYYRHLLRLPQPPSDAATFGVLLHRVMEVFNQQLDKGPYTADFLKQLADGFFAFEESPEQFQELGFTENDRAKLLAISPLTRETLKQRLLASVDDLARKGYFSQYGGARHVEAEKTLQDITLEGLERCRLTGAMDALIQLEDGRWEIVDYKTFGAAYSTSVDRCEQHFINTLSPLPEGEAVSHAERFADKLNPAYPKDYQLPLYYLACNQNPLYQGKLRGVAIQMVRPAFPDKPEQGAVRLAISSDELEANKEAVLSDIQRYIVDPILSGSVFEATPAQGACDYCAYNGICESGDAREGEANNDQESK